MTKEEFISQLDAHYEEGRRLANAAKSLIWQMVGEVGDMPFEYLYNEKDDENADPDWCYMEDNFRLHGIYPEDNTIIIRQVNDYGELSDIQIEYLTPSDIIELADFLLRR